MHVPAHVIDEVRTLYPLHSTASTTKHSLAETGKIRRGVWRSANRMYSTTQVHAWLPRVHGNHTFDWRLCRGQKTAKLPYDFE
jgi:hypothetical protein